jgi:hypothetical protein
VESSAFARLAVDALTRDGGRNMARLVKEFVEQVLVALPHLHPSSRPISTAGSTWRA